MIAVKNGKWLIAKLHSAEANEIIELEPNTTYKVKSMEITKPLKIIGKAGSKIMLSRGALTVKFDSTNARAACPEDQDLKFSDSENSLQSDNNPVDKLMLT